MGRILMYKLRDLIKNAYILPIYALCVADMAWVGLCCYHCAQNPDISWHRRYNEPFEAYRNKTYKFWMSDEYRENHVCHAPTPPCYLSKEEEEEQQKQQAEIKEAEASETKNDEN